MTDDERLEAIEWLRKERNLSLASPSRVSDDDLMVAMFQELKALLEEKDNIEHDLELYRDTGGFGV